MHHARHRDFMLLNQCDIPVVPVERSHNRIAPRFVHQDYLKAHPEHHTQIADNNEEWNGESEEHSPNSDSRMNNHSELAGLNDDSGDEGESPQSEDDEDHTKEPNDDHYYYINPSLMDETSEDDGEIPQFYRPSGAYN
ncbi:hypothetical protein BS47DRAFT_1395290 [Hydnum rufescens UP504]|uniref:Uncharacterized protein n=1 Tax=Hydnum rufescens UP504 TaxID=1448309 RepID=A0A9P6AST5_9AGAM|nr:hypothetical protein BS47DRAFT_1395290 [Hydnum rufescens UP504]